MHNTPLNPPNNLSYSSLPYIVHVPHLTFSMLDWAKARLPLTDYRWFISGGAQDMYFKNEHDAVAFKLTFNLS